MVHAQTEPEAGQGSAELQSQTDTVQLPVGTKMAVKYTTDPRTFPDLVLENVTDSALVIGGDTIGVEYFERISVRKPALYKAGRLVFLVSASIVVAMGICLALMLLFAGNATAMIVLGIFLILLSIPGTFAFPTGLIVGGVLLLISNKTYALGYRWKLQASSKKSTPPTK